VTEGAATTDQTTGWCGPCSRPRPEKDPPRIWWRVRATATSRRSGLVLGVLAAPPRTAVPRRRESHRPLARTTALLGDLIGHLATGAFPVLRLRHDRPPGQTAGGRAPQPPPGLAGADPHSRPVHGVTGPRAGDPSSPSMGWHWPTTTPNGSRPGVADAASTLSPIH
jgi:hypothetical protein